MGCASPFGRATSSAAVRASAMSKEYSPVDENVVGGTQMRRSSHPARALHLPHRLITTRMFPNRLSTAVAIRGLTEERRFAQATAPPVDKRC
jgi:hypothetical protein